ncbi:hypothetical protein C0995_015622 [Termitomyces sp. Mi166|nr:hypothetical protein C0995_015615 [Termitomyces sp. Mi166\
MTAIHAPSNSWAPPKDRPSFYRSPSSQIRSQSSQTSVSNKNPFAAAANQERQRERYSGSSDGGTATSTNPFASSYAPSAPEPEHEHEIKHETSAPAPTTSTLARVPSPPTNNMHADPDPDSPASPPVRSLDLGRTKNPNTNTEDLDTKVTTKPGPRAVSEPGLANAVGCAIESVKPYIPESVVAYLPTSAAGRKRKSERPGGDGVSESGIGKVREAEGRGVERRKGSVDKKHAKPYLGLTAATIRSHFDFAQHSPEREELFPQICRRISPDKNIISAGSTAPPSQLPSNETPGGSSIGVGSLPGNRSETSVAKLPEERRLEGMPSHESGQQVLGKSGGVGALPGGPDESAVALLPEERDNQRSVNQTADVRIQYIPNTKSASEKTSYDRATLKIIQHALTKKIHVSMQVLALERGPRLAVRRPPHSTPLPTRHVNFQVPSASPRGLTSCYIYQKIGLAGFGGTAAHPDVRLDPGYHPAELHPLDPKFKQDSVSKVPSDTDTNTNRRSSASTQSEGHSSTSSGERRKVGLMSRMKGEVKVLSGKLSHNEKKIQAGRQMMGK